MYTLFNYTKIRYDDYEMPLVKLAELYCEAKPFWWNWFFGWRGTFSKDNGYFCYYILPKRIVKKIYSYAEKYLDFLYD